VSAKNSAIYLIKVTQESDFNETLLTRESEFRISRSIEAFSGSKRSFLISAQAFGELLPELRNPNNISNQRIIIFYIIYFKKLPIAARNTPSQTFLSPI
jgi:hypothetical protein